MKAILKNCTLFAAVVFLFTGCAIITNGISYQKDRLMGTSRYTWHETFATNQLHEQQYEQDISILKEIDARQQVTYTMYDIISLPMKSFDVSNEMYIIIDNEVIPLNIPSRKDCMMEITEINQIFPNKILRLTRLMISPIRRSHG